MSNAKKPNPKPQSEGLSAPVDTDWRARLTHVAFVLAIGAYTGAALSGSETGRVIGFGITSLPVWLLASGLVAALFGVLVAPVAVRLRGLYLAIVTLGLVFLGEHVFREWTSLTGEGIRASRRGSRPAARATRTPRRTAASGRHVPAR